MLSLRLALVAATLASLSSNAAPTFNSRQDSSLDPYPNQDLVTFGEDGKFNIMIVTGELTLRPTPCFFDLLRHVFPFSLLPFSRYPPHR